MPKAFGEPGQPASEITRETVDRWRADALRSSAVKACSAAKPCSDKCGTCSGHCLTPGQQQRRVCAKQRRLTPLDFSYGAYEAIAHVSFEREAGKALPMTRICSECTHAFCFTCSPNEYCSQAGCSRVLCSDCSRGKMEWCSDCERTFCNAHPCEGVCK
jgi:hypothetical protein